MKHENRKQANDGLAGPAPMDGETNHMTLTSTTYNSPLPAKSRSTVSISSGNGYGNENDDGTERETNAFAVLMSGKKKKKMAYFSNRTAPRRNLTAARINRKKESDFVECPSCHSFISFANINIHLDKCMNEEDSSSNGCLEGPNQTQGLGVEIKETKGIEGPVSVLDSKSEVKAELIASDEKNASQKRRRDSVDGLGICSNGKSKRSRNMNSSTSEFLLDVATIDKALPEEQPNVNSPIPTTPSPLPASDSVSTSAPAPNAFSHMMQQSKKVYDLEINKVEKQCFHLSMLDNKFHLQWLCSGGGNGHNDEFEKIRLNHLTNRLKGSNVQWSGQVMLRASNEEKQSFRAKDVELHLTSSIPSDPPFPTVREPFVQRPSKFSVPVLKSMLQKSIRRRRPLPSVRLAMELADKSYVDLIRRLPIICLEDSFLHHDFPLLCWLMAADSKDFVAPRRLMERLMEIVFEIASCPWKDSCNNRGPEENVLTLSHVLSSPSLGEKDDTTDLSNDFEQCDLMLKSMILRKKYGGMACDKRMMDDFISLWSERYQSVKVGNSTMTRTFPNGTSTVLWKDVPLLIHSSINSTKMVEKVLSSQLQCLKLHDVCSAGVDFHCSNVIDYLMNNASSNLVMNLSKHLGTESKERIKDTLKQMIWDYSAGVNNRRSFTSKDLVSETDKNAESTLKQIWQKDVFSQIKEFTTGYIASRLVQLPS